MKKIAWILIGFMLASQAVWAHEKRTVGNSDWVVGFLKEPAFSGEMNAVDLRVKRGEELVTGLEETLTAQVFYEDGAESLPVSFKSRYKEPGAYSAYFLPSKPGNYTFLIKGTIEGAAVEERFASKDGRFSPVKDSEKLRFPK